MNTQQEYERKERQRQYRKSEKGKRTRELSRLTNLYRMSPEQKRIMIASQNYLCAICQLHPPTDVDHDHATGKVRGVLCRGCNTALGHMQDNPKTLERAIQYLEKNSGNHS